jgi:hypothetical protein
MNGRSAQWTVLLQGRDGLKCGPARPNRLWVLGTLIYEGGKLETGGGCLDPSRNIHTNPFPPSVTPIVYLPLLNSAAIKTIPK